MENVRDAIKCPVCHEVNRSTPRNLPCGHTFCEECLERLKDGSRRIKCPLCTAVFPLRDGEVRELPINFAVLSLKEQNEGAEQARLPFDFCILTQGENDDIKSLAVDILALLEKEKIDDRKVKGYWKPRDAQPGKLVLKNIGNSIKESKFILVLLHRSNIESAWMEMKHNMALNAMLNNPERKDSVIPIYLCEKENPLLQDEKPDELSLYDGLTYIINDENNNEEFWKKLGKTVIDKEINIDSGYSFDYIK